MDSPSRSSSQSFRILILPEGCRIAVSLVDAYNFDSSEAERPRSVQLWMKKEEAKKSWLRFKRPALTGIDSVD
jgi:hypothetical protein